MIELGRVSESAIGQDEGADRGRLRPLDHAFGGALAARLANSERGGPRLDAVLEPPGPLALNYGRETPIVTLVAPIIYGASLGAFLTPG